MDRRTYIWKFSVLQDIVPFGSTAQKAFAEVVALALALKRVAVAEAVAVIEATAVALAVAVAIAGMAVAKVAKEEVATPVTCWAGAETTGQGQQSPHVGWTAGQGQKDAQKRQKATATN